MNAKILISRKILFVQQIPKGMEVMRNFHGITFPNFAFLPQFVCAIETLNHPTPAEENGR